jgi:uncharacterized protein YlxW (UPF0749 family)
MSARARGGAGPMIRPQWTLSMAVALAAIGFVAAAQWNSSLAREEFVTSAQRVLVTRAEELQREQDTLRTRIEQADADLQELQERAASSRAELDLVNERLEAARIVAGRAELRGPGMVLEIADSLREVPPGESAGFFIVVADLRDIVAALWGSGAEAISISGSATEGAPAERLVASSSIYGGGAGILINGTALSPPYRITAIGPDGLHDRFQAHPAFLARVLPRIEAYDLQFESEARAEVTVPAFLAIPPLRWGVPVDEAGGP